MAAEYYDEILFENATYADLMNKPGTMAIATGTDISTGPVYQQLLDEFNAEVAR